MDPLLAGERIESGEHVSHVGRALEVQRLGSRPHPPLDAAADLLGITLEDPDDLVDHSAVLLFTLKPDARSLAPADVVVEACAFGPLTGQVVSTRANRVQPLHHFQGLAHRPDGRVRAEVSAPVVHDAARHVDPGERLPYGHLDVRVLLVVPEKDVEPWPMLLDEVGLEDQRLGLRAHHDRLQSLDVPHHLAVLRAQVRVRLEVTSHSCSERLRLPDVQHRPLGATEEVHPWFGGELGDEFGIDGHGLDAELRRRRGQAARGRRQSPPTPRSAPAAR